eukprot:CAMPEP_0171297422 /NCGR_PEP_ID=MMETSP0816-20121228/6162_1 /TAXON_ID=420281 /ORGANISM="Proboscia inermis, Strain CCAP1064/1" /LENGTH=367 /DNA_ID=CAMNT_0011771679 /DNA_START=15 /DNA_END=1118 /DNA_ORIENTATION=+
MPHVELPQAEFKVVMLGDSNAGKTSLVLRFAEGYYRDAAREPTVGAFFITKRIQTSNGITCKIQIWDTAGQAKFRSMAPMYYRNAAAAIVCYDVTSSESYRVMTDWLKELHSNVQAGSIVIAIAATKCDVLSEQNCGESQPHPAVPHIEAESLANELGAIFVNTSSKENIGVADLYQRVGERVLQFRESQASNGVGIPVTPGKTALHTSSQSNGGNYSVHTDKNPLLGSPGALSGIADNSVVDLSPYMGGYGKTKGQHDGANSIINTHDQFHPGYNESKEGGISSPSGTRGRNGTFSTNRKPPSLRTENIEAGTSHVETLPGIMCSESPMGCGIFTSSSNADESLVDENELSRDKASRNSMYSCCIS